MSFSESVQRGDAFGALRMASVYSALWAIGSSWSTAIREIARVIVPANSTEAVVAEILAAGVVTVLGMGISLLVTRNCCAPLAYVRSMWRDSETPGERSKESTKQNANSSIHDSNVPPSRVFVRVTNS